MIVPMLTDTHAHLDFPDFETDLDAVIDRANRQRVNRVITIGTTLESSRKALEIAEKYAHVYAAVGVHPGNALEAPDDVITPLRELAKHPKVVAIGECGLDYYRLPEEQIANEPTESLATSPEEALASIRSGAIIAAQESVFTQQLELAAELGLNVVVHQRSAWQDTFDVIQPYTGRVRCVFHCFVGTLEEAQDLIQLAHLVSFTGIVTFKNAEEVKKTAQAVPLESLMVETDSPYLAPVPHRGKRAEPMHVRLVAEEIAKLRGISLAELSEATERTANAFFRFRLP